MDRLIPNERIKLLEIWNDNLFSEYGIAEIMKLAGKKSKPWVFNTLKILSKHKLLILSRKGNMNIYSLNINNPNTIHFLQYLEAQRGLDFPQLDLIQETITSIHLKNYCLIVFGSFSQGKQKKGSDLDLCFLIDAKSAAKRIKPYFNEIKLNHAVSVDEHYITFNEFKKMLLRKEENLGKQIYRKHLLFFNQDIYYQLIIEAHKNGFRL
ncbi:nucleotidyltransferase domain-containing protein [Candidatus Woesearchaeota archaeon]|nr:nucleotidyltransferase domain-containing protein [Candidatus Woesearchaeota archaeon]